jgi:gamma-carbonic anhydrase
MRILNLIRVRPLAAGRKEFAFFRVLLWDKYTKLVYGGMTMKKTELKENVNVGAPSVHATSFVAKNATVIGHVKIAAEASVWYSTVIRGDINTITIGERTNIQDLSMIHVENDLGCHIGNDVTVGHRAILHACTIEDGVLIGMGAIVLNGAVIKKGAVIGAGAVVKEGSVVEEYSLWVGVPAKEVSRYTEKKFQENKAWAAKYVKLAKQHRSKALR